MNERDNGDSERSKEVDIFVQPLEQVISANGEEGVICEAIVAGYDLDSMEQAAKEFIEQTGIEVLDERATRAFHALSSTRWNSPWNPPGPKPNWRKPQEPSPN